MTKPLGRKAYGSIPHLWGSRIGPGDHKINLGQHRLCTSAYRRKDDQVIVEEKLDGSCCAVSRDPLTDEIIPLTRKGYRAETSLWLQHHYFAAWVHANAARFRMVLGHGEWLAGEWLAQAHGTRYHITDDPFVAFDLFTPDGTRFLYDDRNYRFALGQLVTPRLISRPFPVRVDEVVGALAVSGHGALDPVEGAVWRVEHKGRVDLLAKYVRPDFVPGRFLPELSGQDPIWNWQPAR